MGMIFAGVVGRVNRSSRAEMRLRGFAQTAPVTPVDRYTIAHGALGFVLGLWGAPWWVALGTTLAFELVEDGLKKVAPGIFPVGLPDTWANSLIDSGAWMTGWGLAQALPPEPAKMWRRRTKTG